MFSPQSINQEAFSYYRRLHRLKEYALSRPSQSLSLAGAASTVGLEKSYFSKYFHEKIGVCFHDWVNYIHVQHAMTLLRESDITITRAAEEAGFSNLRTFERVFLKHAGVTPRAFKKAVRPS